MPKFILTASLAFAFLLSGCSSDAPEAQAVDTLAVQEATHDKYVAALNSNDLELIMDSLAEDIVYQGPGSPETIGKAAVRDRMTNYLKTYSDDFDKSVRQFTVSGDWAFSRYTYQSTTTNNETGEVTKGVGKGVFIFRRDADGVWRLVLDSWNSDRE